MGSQYSGRAKVASLSPCFLFLLGRTKAQGPLFGLPLRTGRAMVDSLLVLWKPGLLDNDCWQRVLEASGDRLVMVHF